MSGILVFLLFIAALELLYIVKKSNLLSLTKRKSEKLYTACIVIMSVISLAVHGFVLYILIHIVYVVYILIIICKDPNIIYEQRNWAAAYSLDDVISRKEQKFEYSIAITDKYIYKDGEARYLVIDAHDAEASVKIHEVKDERCHYSIDGGWFCKRKVLHSCSGPKITKVQADHLLKTFRDFNNNDGKAPLPGKLFSPFDIYVVGGLDKNESASVIHVPKLSVRAKKSTVNLVKEIQSIFPEIEKLFSTNCQDN